MNTTINNINLVEFFEAEDTSTIGCFLYCGDAQVACGCINRSDVRELLAMNTDPCGLFPITDISLLLMLDRIDLEPDERTEEEESEKHDLKSLKALLVSGYVKLENVLGVHTPLQIRALVQSIRSENAVLRRMWLEDVPF